MQSGNHSSLDDRPHSLCPGSSSALLLPNGSTPNFQEMRRTSNINSANANRADMYLRHSSHPCASHQTRQLYTPQYDCPPFPIGTRKPISRATKACNACRSSKVRCEAGANNPCSVSAEPSRCSRCRKADIPCIFSDIQSKRGLCPGYEFSSPSTCTNAVDLLHRTPRPVNRFLQRYAWQSIECPETRLVEGSDRVDFAVRPALHGPTVHLL